MRDFLLKLSARGTATGYRVRSKVQKTIGDEKGFSVVELAVCLGVMCLMLYLYVKPSLSTGFAEWGQNAIAWLRDSAH